MLAFASFVHSFIPQTPLEPLPYAVVSQVGEVSAQAAHKLSDCGISRIRGPLCTSVGFPVPMSHALGLNCFFLSLSMSCIATVVPQALDVFPLDFPSHYQLSVPRLGL